MKDKRKKIVISSLLKPVDDVRMYEKFGLNIKSYLNFDVEIIGSKSEIPENKNQIKFHPLFIQKRFGLTRFFPSLKYYIKLLKAKPDLIIVNTHDLQIVNIFYKILFGSKLLYDIRENYYNNSLYMGGFGLFKWIIALWVRCKELWNSYWIDGNLLAEKSYNKILFTKKKSVIVENKYMPTVSNNKLIKDNFLLVYSGTISLEYGILEAIEYAEIYNKKDSRYHLIIIGYCANNFQLKMIKAKINDLVFVKLVGGNHTVPHDHIIDLISKATIALLPYHLNKAVLECIPSKIYECFNTSTKIDIKNNNLWKDKIFSIYQYTNIKNTIFLANKFKLLKIIKCILILIVLV